MSQPTRASPEEDPKHIITALCVQFCRLGWITKTGGGISIRHQGKIYISPSRLQKGDVIELAIEGDSFDLEPPKKKLKTTQCCLPLFACLHAKRNAGAVIHTHSKHAATVTLCFPGKEFKCTHLQNIMGVKNETLGKNYRNDEELVIPIVDNASSGDDLKDRLEQAVADYPETCSVLVRGHGMFVWGDTWEQAKIRAECCEYLFEAVILMKRMGHDPSSTPADHELKYQQQNEKNLN